MRTRGIIIAIVAAMLACGMQAAGGDGSPVTVELGGGRTLAITERSFDAWQAKVENCREGSGICRINGGIPFGVGAGMPKTVLVKMSLTVEGRTYDLDVSNMYNAWGRRHDGAGDSRHLAATCYDRENCVVRGIFSDAASAYVAEWAVVDGRTSRTMLTGSRDVVDLFQRHLEPPGFE
jgi:hypothetical protein